MAASRNYSQSVIAASDEIKDIFCEPCVGDGKQVAAKGFCVNCSEYLCGQCYNSHGRFKAFKQHVLQDKTSMPIDVERAGAIGVCVEKCPKHPAMVTEFFCRSCDTLGCSACITTNHLQCKNVDHIPDIVKDLENDEEFVEYEKKVIDKLKNIIKREEKIHSRETDVNDMRKQANAELKKQRDEINKFFDHLEAEMNKTITVIDKNNNDTLKTASERCTIISDELHKMKTAMETKKKNGQRCELFISMKQSKASMKNIDRQFKMLTKESQIQRYKLVKSTQTEEMMKNTTEVCRMFTAKYVSDINVTTNIDNETPRIEGFAVVQEHYLAVADENIKTVKIIDTRNGSVTSEMSLDCDWVLNVTSIMDDQIVVSVLSQQHHGISNELLVLGVSASGTLSTSNVIIAEQPVHNIVDVAQFLFLLQDDKIQVIDMQGNVRDEIKIEKTAGFIAVSPDKETIYLTDVLKGSVTMLTLDGTVITIHKDLKKPAVIAINKDGYVYVRSSKTIHQLTKECTEVQALVDDVCGIRIAYSGADNRLYVAERCKVKVYEL